MTSDLRSVDTGGNDASVTTLPAPFGGPAHLPPTITYLGTLADITLGTGGASGDGLGDMSAGIPGG